MTAAHTDRGKITERMVVGWLRRHGWPAAERTLATGSVNGDRVRADLGDITGAPGVCWQVKALRPVGRAERAVPMWMGETEIQRAAAGATIGVLVVRRDGTTDVGEWWAFLRLDAAARLVLDPARVVRFAASSVPIRFLLRDATALLHEAGYRETP